MRASLTTDLETDCSIAAGTEFQEKYRVGRNWWMHAIAEPYIADQYPNKPPIGEVLGGQLQAYDLVSVCPFLETIRNRGIPTAGTVQIAEDFCKEADASSVRTALDTVIGTDYGIDPKDVIFIIGAGIPTFCPQHTEAAINAFSPDTPSPKATIARSLHLEQLLRLLLAQPLVDLEVATQQRRSTTSSTADGPSTMRPGIECSRHSFLNQPRCQTLGERLTIPDRRPRARRGIRSAFPRLRPGACSVWVFWRGLGSGIAAGSEGAVEAGEGVGDRFVDVHAASMFS